MNQHCPQYAIATCTVLVRANNDNSVSYRGWPVVGGIGAEMHSQQLEKNHDYSGRKYLPISKGALISNDVPQNGT